MGLSGKYDFKGIQKFGAAGLRLALAASPYTAWILKGGFLTDFVLNFAVNWLANNGLLVLNVAATYASGEFDQHAFNQAIDKAIQDIQNKGGRDKLSAAEKRAIDDEVIQAARDLVVLTRPS